MRGELGACLRGRIEAPLRHRERLGRPSRIAMAPRVPRPAVARRQQLPRGCVADCHEPACREVDASAYRRQRSGREAGLRLYEARARHGHR